MHSLYFGIHILSKVTNEIWNDMRSWLGLQKGFVKIVEWVLVGAAVASQLVVRQTMGSWSDYWKCKIWIGRR